MTLVFIMTSEVTAQGSRHQEVCAWTFFWGGGGGGGGGGFSHRFSHSIIFILRIYLIFLFSPCLVIEAGPRSAVCSTSDP